MESESGFMAVCYETPYWENDHCNILPKQDVLCCR